MGLVETDIQTPGGWIENCALFSWYAQEIQASCRWLNTSVVKGVHMNPKEDHVAAVSWLNIWKKKSRLALLGSLWISPLTTNERTLDTYGSLISGGYTKMWTYGTVTYQY